MATAPGHFRLFYVDDSGSMPSGLIVYSWLECQARGWRTGLQSLLDLRRLIHDRYAIPPDYQLHAADFAAGRGNPSTNPDWNRRKHLRGEVMRYALAHLAQCPEIRTGTVYRTTMAKRHAYAHERADLYRQLVNHLDARLARDGEHGLIFTDGNGTDQSYTSAHRSLTLDRRRLVEDAQFHGKRNLWLQMADLVAWTAFQHLHRAPNRMFAWTWYIDHLQTADVRGTPAPL